MYKITPYYVKQTVRESWKEGSANTGYRFSIKQGRLL